MKHLTRGKFPTLKDIVKATYVSEEKTIKMEIMQNHFIKKCGSSIRQSFHKQAMKA